MKKNHPKDSIKILVLNGWVRYAPYEKRIRALKSVNCEIEVLAFEREIKLGNNTCTPYKKLGQISKGKYLTRVPVLLRSLFNVRKKIYRVDAVYALGFEMGFLAALVSCWLSATPRIAYEIHDIRDIVLEDSIASKILRKIEEIFLKKVQVLIVTSSSYITHYYSKLYGTTKKTVMVENKVLKQDHRLWLNNRSTISLNTGNNGSDKVIIGYFGSLRCEVAWDYLKRITREGKGRIRVIIRGVTTGITGFNREIGSNRLMQYGGPYQDPEDLAQIYQNVDLVWAAGYHGKISYKWARACRFYYACFFKIPVIANSDSDDGIFVREYDIGLSVDMTNRDKSIREILAISADDLIRWKKNLEKLPETYYVYTDEDKEIINSLLELRR